MNGYVKCVMKIFLSGRTRTLAMILLSVQRGAVKCAIRFEPVRAKMCFRDPHEKQEYQWDFWGKYLILRWQTILTSHPIFLIQDFKSRITSGPDCGFRGS